jgi:hypothetical protein
MFLAMLINNFMTNRKKNQALTETILVYSLSKVKKSMACCKCFNKVKPLASEEPTLGLSAQKKEQSLIKQRMTR